MENLRCARSTLSLIVCFFMVAFTTGAAIAAEGAMYAAGGPGLHHTALIADESIEAGTVSTWNSPQKLMIQVDLQDDWLISEIQIYAGYPEINPIPVQKGCPRLGRFPYKKEYQNPSSGHMLTLDLKDDLGFSWGSQYENLRAPTIAVHVDLVKLDQQGEVIAEEGSWAYGPDTFDCAKWGWTYTYLLAHPRRGHFIDSPVHGLSYHGPTQQGITAEEEGFLFFPGENILFSINSVELGVASAGRKVSPLDLFSGADTNDPRVIGVARVLQTLDMDSGAEKRDGKITILPDIAECFAGVVADKGLDAVDYGDIALIDELLEETVSECSGQGGAELAVISAADAKGNLEAGLRASNIFRKNVSKTEDWGEGAQKIEVMPVYFPGKRSNGDPSYCDLNDNDVYDEDVDQIGVPYEEWRVGGDPDAEECDPRLPDGTLDENCSITLIECREVAKPIVVTYREKIDISDANKDFNECGDELTPGCRDSYDIYAAISRDDGNTWKRTNISRMADLSSFELKTGENFPGTTNKHYLKVNDNYILSVWESKFCKSGNPRYAIRTCDDPATEEVEADDPLTEENECAIYCVGNPDHGTEVCTPDYPYDDEYAITDIWGVRGKQRSVDYDEVDDVAELGIGEIPYSCLWAARGVIVTQKDLDSGAFASLNVEDDPITDVTQCTDVKQPYECCTGEGTGECDESKTVELGDIVWFKPERLTSGRRDVYIPATASARGAGFAIAWQEDPSGLRPGKGKGPGQGWSGAISNHKTDIWYSYLTFDDFAGIDENFVPGGPGDDPNGEANFDERPGLGRPKAQVPFALPVRISDNDMANSDTLKVEQSSQCETPPNGTEPVCFPEVADGTFVTLDSEIIAQEFCDHPDSDPATCCDPDNHQEDPNCEDLKGLYGNLTGTKRYTFLAKTLDDDKDGVPDYQYFVDNGGTLDLCDTSGENRYMDELPGTSAHERWYGFTNKQGSSKLVCVTSDGRLLDGDVSASRPNIKMQPYTKPDGTKSAWVLLGYEESKGMGHSQEGAGDNINPVDDIITGQDSENKGEEKPIKQDIGKNVIYHSFDFTQPDLVSPGHVVNLPALCGGLYPEYCGEDYEGDNPTCTCELGQPVPLYFDYRECSDPDNASTCEWMPDDTQFLQFRTEIARRARFIMQSPGKMGASKTLGAIIYKQGQEGQGRPADVFIRRMVKSGTGNPYKFENFECTTYLDETFVDLQGCPNGAGEKPSDKGYSCNVWGEAYGDRLCGGINETLGRRDHINLTSSDIDLKVDAGPEDDTPDDPTDDLYGREKVLLWSQHDYNLGDESYGVADVSTCTDVSCAGMYSNARSHRGFIRGDLLLTAFAYSPNWAAGRNGNDRYNFYTRRSFDGGQTWTTTPADLGGTGVHYCREWRTDPTTPDEDGSGNAPPVLDGFDPECIDWCAPDDTECVVTGMPIAAGAFEPARKVSEFDNNKETTSDPRVGATPPQPPLDGRDPALPVLKFVEDIYQNNIFFVAWGGGDNVKSTGGTDITPEAAPTDIWYTRTVDYGDHYLKMPWVIGGENSNQGVGETVWRYDFLAKGDEEQGECQIRATPDGSKMYSVYHQLVPPEEDPDEPLTRWFPWEPEESFLNDIWFRRVIFYPDTYIEEQ